MAIDAETGIFDCSADPPPAGSLQSAAGGLPERLVVLPFAVSFLALFHEALRGRERRSRGDVGMTTCGRRTAGGLSPEA